jgi:3-hydroxy-9,10-secoandrosta-1,3,5(10)-triene-9,17-dione monooxygenase reductase component
MTVTTDLPVTRVEPDDFRHVLGHFASGITVVTAIDDGEPVGFACQSFTSLSLDPPLVLFCPSKSSTTWPRIQRAGRFCIRSPRTSRR